MAKTLLLADDSVTIQRVIELTFAHEDVRVVAVADGKRAVEYISVERPDIVVADVGVAEVDGFGIVAHMKKSAALRDIPVLLLAGAFEPVDEGRVRASGCDGILVKPFEPQQLVGRVKELLAERRGKNGKDKGKERNGSGPVVASRAEPARAEVAVAAPRGGGRTASVPDAVVAVGYAVRSSRRADGCAGASGNGRASCVRSRSRWQWRGSRAAELPRRRSGSWHGAAVRAGGTGGACARADQGLAGQRVLRASRPSNRVRRPRRPSRRQRFPSKHRRSGAPHSRPHDRRNCPSGRPRHRRAPHPRRDRQDQSCSRIDFRFRGSAVPSSEFAPSAPNPEPRNPGTTMPRHRQFQTSQHSSGWKRSGLWEQDRPSRSIAPCARATPLIRRRRR